MTDAEYLRCDAMALAALVRRGEVSAAELLAIAIARRDRVEPRIHAIAQRLDNAAHAQLRDLAPGPLAGAPFLIKDCVHDYAGTPTTQGSRALRAAPPAPAHAAVVRRYLDAGLVIFGKTHLSELALKASADGAGHAPSCNPWRLERVPGGSSGGAAAAVAAGIVPMAAGNDGGGSIRIPAACCGLFGLRPSRGRVSSAPAHGEVWSGASSEGVLTRSVRDCAQALDILQGPEPGDPFQIAAPAEPYLQAMQRAPGRLRIGFCTDSPIGTPVDAQAAGAVHDAARLLESLGHDVEAAAPQIDGAALALSYLHLYFGLVSAAVAAACRGGARRCEFELTTRLLAALGDATSAGRYVEQRDAWNTYARGLADFHRRFDLYLTPATAQPAVPHGSGDLPRAQQGVLGALERSGLLRVLAGAGVLDGLVQRIARDNLAFVPFTQLANLTGTPAMSVPLAMSSDGLPLGVHFIARFGREDLLLQLAHQLEQAAPWFERMPPGVAA
jgi:amidase